MKYFALFLALLFLSFNIYAWDDRYEISTDKAVSSSGTRDIEMRKKYDSDPSNKYRGEVEKDGYVTMRNSNGDRVRGTIDSDGYGRLRDQNGNSYRVKPN